MIPKYVDYRNSFVLNLREEFFNNKIKVNDAVQVSIDDKEGDVEADAHDQDGHEDAVSVSLGLVVPNQGSGWKFKRLAIASPFITQPMVHLFELMFWKQTELD